jgi:hypothetical protein
MSKAEERALEVFPLEIDGDSRGSYDLNVVKRIVYQQGYEQAEKDLELTVEDIVHIIETYNELEFSREFATVTFNDTCKEVLKRFKEIKK